MNWLLINLMILPLVFFLLAILLIKLTSIPEKSLSEDSRIKAFLLQNKNIYNPTWLANRIDAIFTISLLVMLVGITIAYS